MSKLKEKSRGCRLVLTFMDMDYTYQQALKMVLTTDKRLSKINLEKELNLYI